MFPQKINSLQQKQLLLVHLRVCSARKWVINAFSNMFSGNSAGEVMLLRGVWLMEH